jgi:hypothetical protein
MANEFTIHLQHHFFPVFGVSLRMAISFPSFGIGGRILLLGILRFFEKHMKEFEPPECTFLPEGPMLMAFAVWGCVHISAFRDSTDFQVYGP